MRFQRKQKPESNSIVEQALVEALELCPKTCDFCNHFSGNNGISRSSDKGKCLWMGCVVDENDEACAHYNQPYPRDSFICAECDPKDQWFEFWPDLESIDSDSIVFGLDCSIEDFPLKICLCGRLMGMSIQIRLEYPDNLKHTPDGWTKCDFALLWETVRF